MNRSTLTTLIKEYTIITFSRSSGPGGQNVNKVNTKVTIAFPVVTLGPLPEYTAQRLKNRINTDGFLILQVDEERSQLHNKSIALQRLTEILINAFIPPRPRKKTRPTHSSILSRLATKKTRSRLKTLRSNPHPQD